MARITRDEVVKLARISALTIQEHEIEQYIQSLEPVLAYADCLKDIALCYPDVEPLPQQHNVMRADIIVRTDSTSILASSPAHEGNYFIVPVIIKQH